MTSRRSAPVYLNLLRIQFPVGAVTSIGHRISGVLLFASFPWLTYLLDLSLRDAAGFERACWLLQSGAMKLASVPVVWSLFHHLFSGVRFLLIDLETGVTLHRARSSAWLVNTAGVLATLLYLAWIR
jgi:succinate dehydrogenase / fumarate reductase cytochrome b subunit